MATRKNPLRMVSALGIGVVLGTVAWLAFNLAGIAIQVASVGQHFPAAPAASVERGVVAPAAGDREVPVSAPEATQFGRDIPPQGITRDSEQADYVAAFDVPSASVRAPLPDNGRLVMDPTMFAFDENDAELQAAIDELMVHPDEEVRRAASENLLPAVRR